MPKVLVVDDDQDLAEMLGIVITGAGMDVEIVSRGDEAVNAFHENKPDLVLLDLMLPGIDGIEVCKQIRQESMVPIVMLTAKGDSYDVVAGLEAGADDYIVKPLPHPSELIARIRTRLRRITPTNSGIINLGDLQVDLVSHEVLRDGKKILLTRLEFELLAALLKDPGRVFSRDALLSEVWGYHHSTDTRLVNVHVQRLRSKVERDPENPELILTVRGVGYRAGRPN
jgi:two-component system response regulator MtrA